MVEKLGQPGERVVLAAPQYLQCDHKIIKVRGHGDVCLKVVLESTWGFYKHSFLLNPEQMSTSGLSTSILHMETNFKKQNWQGDEEVMDEASSTRWAHKGADD